MRSIIGRGYWSIATSKLKELNATDGVLVLGPSTKPGSGHVDVVRAVYINVRWRVATEEDRLLLKDHPEPPDTGRCNRFKVFDGSLDLASELIGLPRSVVVPDVQFTQKGVPIVTIEESKLRPGGEPDIVSSSSEQVVHSTDGT